MKMKIKNSLNEQNLSDLKDILTSPGTSKDGKMIYTTDYYIYVYKVDFKRKRITLLEVRTY